MPSTGKICHVALVRTDVSEESVASIIRLTRQNGVFWDLRRVALVRTDVSEELSASFIRVTRIGD
jgi:hypothetical protein